MVGTEPAKGTDQAAEPPRPRKWRSLRRFWWLGLIILIVGICGSVYIVEFQTCYPLKPTNDPLFDRYAQAVRNRQAWRLFTCRRADDYTNVTTLPDELLAGWEGDFGDDPRYWQLRYWSAKYRHHQPLRKNARFHADSVAAIKHLETARERGVADAETLLLLYQEGSNLWYEQIEEELDASPDKPPQNLDDEKSTAVAINREYEARIMAVLDAAVAAEPDNCWPYWERACLNLSYGEEAAALADLRLGNAAGTNKIPQCYPASKVMDFLSCDMVPGNRVLAGAIMETAFETPYLSLRWIQRFKTTAKEQELRIALGGDTDLTDAMYHCACRIARADRGYPLNSFGMAVAIHILTNTCLEQCATGLTAEQIQVLCEIESGYQKVYREEQSRTRCNALMYPAFTQVFYDQRFNQQGHLAILSYTMLGDWPGNEREPPGLNSLGAKYSHYMLKYPSRYYARLFDVWGHNVRSDRYISEFSALDAVDFTTLAKPDGWRPYPLFVH